jgi:hypothetical protein
VYNGISPSSLMGGSLFSIRQTYSFLQSSQKKLSSGLKIASPLDNPASFFTASKLTRRAYELSEVIDNAARTKRSLQAAQTGLTGINSLLRNAQSLANRALTATSVPSGAGLTPGSEALVNTFQSGNQGQAPATGAAVNGIRLTDGKSVVVWDSQSQDPDSSEGIYAQLYDVNGVKSGAEFRINTYTAGRQEDPKIAATTDGGFVVAWTSTGQDGSQAGVYAQRFNSSAGTVGSEFKVNTTTADFQDEVVVTGLSGGGFVVSWTSENQDGASDGIYAQRYDASGTMAGSEFLVNTRTANAQRIGDIASLNDGGFVITWMSISQDGSGRGVFAQRYNASGTALGSEFQVNTYFSSDQTDSSVAGLAGGGFVITWESKLQDGSGYGVYAQRYDASGAAAGSEFIVNTTTSGDQAKASATALSDGTFLITWSSNGNSGQDNSSRGVFGQRYTAAGVAIDGEFLINQTTAGDQYSTSTFALANGGFAALWTGQDSSGTGAYRRDWTSGSGGGANTASRAFYAALFNDVRAQIDAVAAESGYDNLNLLMNQNSTVHFNEKGTTNLLVEGSLMNSDGLGLISSLTFGSWATDTEINLALSALTNALTFVSQTSSNFNNKSVTLDIRQSFTDSFIQTLQDGADEITLLDVEEEQANYLALQTRMDLGLYALSMSTQNEQGVLSLLQNISGLNNKN